MQKSAALTRVCPHSACRGGAVFTGQLRNIRSTPASGVGAKRTLFSAGYQTLHHPGKRGGVISLLPNTIRSDSPQALRGIVPALADAFGLIFGYDGRSRYCSALL